MLLVIFFTFIIKSLVANNDNSSSGMMSKFMMQLKDIERYEFSENHIIEKLKGKTINIKIGVYNSDPHRFHSFGTHKHFWIEFDPLSTFSMTNNSMILPFIVTPYNVTHSNFYRCDMGACSSIYLPSGNFPNYTIPEMKNYMIESCNKINSPIKLWDTSSNISHTIMYALTSSLACYNKSLYDKPKVYPSIALHSILDWIPSVVNYLDIDAQGADLPLLLSIKNYLSKIRHIKVECQKQPGYYLYANDVPNECNNVISFLQNNSFALKELEVNNCGISEFNGFFTNKNLQKN